MQSTYQVLPRVSLKDALPLLFLLILLLLFFGYGRGPSRPISYSANRGSASASVGNTNVPTNDETPVIIPPAITGGSQESDRGDIIEEVAVPEPADRSLTVEATRSGVSDNALVFERHPTPQVTGAPTVSLSALIPSNPSPAPTPAVDTTPRPSGWIQIYGFGGGGGSGGSSGGGGGGGGSPAPAPDTTAPASPVISSPASPFSASSTSVSFTGTAESGSTVTQGFSATTATATGGNWTMSLDALPQGTTTISFSARDGAGNMSSATNAVVFIDSVAPNSPTILTPVDSAQASSTSVTFSGTSEAGAVVSQNFSDATVTADVSGAWSLSLTLSQGTTTISFKARDLMGNESLTSSRSVFIDSIVPNAPFVSSPTDGAQASSTTTTFTGTGEALSILSQNFSVATTSVNSNGDWNLSLILPEGTTTIAFMVTDSPGNTSTSTTRSVFIDSLAPSTPSITSPTPLPATVGSTSVTFDGTAEALSTILQDYSGATTTASTLGTWSLPLTLPAGLSTISFWARDALGNTSVATSAPVTVVLVSPPTAPTLSVGQCGANSLSSDVCLSATTTLSLSWDSVASADYYEVYANSASQGTTSATSFSFSASDQATTTLSVVAFNTAGSAPSNVVTVETFVNPLVVNEVAWMGSFTNAVDEWIELFNRTGRTLSLGNITLFVDSTPIALSGTVAGRDFYLIESSASHGIFVDAPLTTQMTPDLSTIFTLADAGGVLTLSAQATKLDQTPAVSAIGCFNLSGDMMSDPSSGWCAGAGNDNQAPPQPLFATMERVNYGVSGTTVSNWVTNDQNHYNGYDDSGTELFGTPKALNSNLQTSGGPYPI